MDKTVPRAAGKLLDFIALAEVDTTEPRGYDIIYGNNQRDLAKPLTRMTVGEVLAAGPTWARKYGSSAAGRYQIMAGTDNTLQDLKRELGLRSGQVFDPDLQDRLAYHLLRRRGWDQWVKGAITHDSFMINLAKEWASLPVPFDMKGAQNDVKRGQSYYDGVGQNGARVSATEVWRFLNALHEEAESPATPPPPIDTDPVPGDPVVPFWSRLTEVFLAYFEGKKAS